MRKPKEANEEKLKAFISKNQSTNSDGGGMSCAALPIESIQKISKEQIRSGKRININFGLMLQVGMFTGLRYSDLTLLRRYNLVDAGEHYILEGKTKKTSSSYMKPISKELGDMLIANSVDNDSGLLLHNNGKEWQHGWLCRKIQKAFVVDLEKAKRDAKRKGERITIGAHSLRKTYGLHIYNTSGINAARIALQHANLATTSKYLGVGYEEQIQIEQAAFIGLW